MIILFLFVTVLFLAYTNGANDNFKGVATLSGSRTLSYRQALTLATVTTFAGSITAIWISAGLVKAFSGKGLVPPALTATPQFLLAVGLGAALTVFLATMTGFPISTTHALTGALVGAGWVAAAAIGSRTTPPPGVAAGSQVNLRVLGQTFFLPLALSPILSFAITTVLYPLFRFVRGRAGISKKLCLCVGLAREPVLLRPDGTAVLHSTGVTLSVGELKECVEYYQGVLLGIDCQRVVDFFHVLSAGAVGFARGLNDAPKIVALIVAAKILSIDVRMGLFLIGLAMALGGILNARHVAQTMSERITGMNHGQGFTANLVTSLLVMIASRFGLPVSTTHVSCGALFGIGAATRKGHPQVIRNVLLSWLITLPVSALCAAGIYFAQNILLR